MCLRPLNITEDILCKAPHSARLDTFDASSPCILAVSTLSNSTAQLARHAELDWLNTTRATHNLVCCVISIKL